MFKSKRDNLRHIYSNICNALFHIFVSVTFSMCEFHCVSAWSRFEKIFQTMDTRVFFFYNLQSATAITLQVHCKH